MLPEITSYFAQLIEAETGIVYDGLNNYQLISRLQEVAKHSQFSSVELMFEAFKQGRAGKARQLLLDTATNNETLFFRDPGFFQAMSDYIVKEILPKKPAALRFWSAASSTGQEALSLAMTLTELGQRHTLPPTQIIASDISEKALEKAKSGFYTDFEMARGLIPEKRDRFFLQRPGGWQARPELLKQIQYQHNNLIHSTILGPFDLILCRNVLIYHRIETKKLILRSLFERLSPHGAVMLGVGETLLGVADELDVTQVNNVMFYRPKKKAWGQSA